MRALTLLLLLVAGCAPLSRTQGGARPADFSLSLFIESKTGVSRLYLVEPDRTLHFAVGRDVHPDLYPPTSTTLTTRQTDNLWQRTRPLLQGEHPAPLEEDTLIYHLTVTTDGQIHRVVTAGQTPGMGRLGVALSDLAGR